MTLYRVEYRENNSGGSWWLNHEDGEALRDAGWLVTGLGDEGEHFLGKAFDYAYLMVEAEDSEVAHFTAIQSFYNATGEDPDTIGCPCCGPPHEFDVADEAEYIRDHTNYRTGEVDDDMTPFDYRDGVE